MAERERYLTAGEVAERLQVSTSWVYRHKQLLRGVQVGERLWRFPERELEAYLAAVAPKPVVRTRTPARRRPPAPAPREWRLTYRSSRSTS